MILPPSSDVTVAQMALIASQSPGDLAAAALAVVFCLAPGAGIAVSVARRLRLGVAAVVAGAFVFSSALAALVMLAGMWLGISLEVGIAVWIGLACGLTVWAWTLGRGQPRLDPDTPGLILAAVAGLFALVERPWLKASADTFYHMAAARSLLARHALVVTDPLHGTAVTVPDPSSGVFNTMLAMMARVTGADMPWLWTGLTIVGAVLLVTAFYALVRRLSGNAWPAAAGTLGYMVFNQFLDFRAAAYPNHISIAVVFFALLCLVEVFDRPSMTAAIAAVFAGVAVSAMHVGNAEFYFLLAATVALWALVDGILARWREGAFAFDGFRVVAGVLLVTGLLASPFVLPKLGVVSGSSMVDTASALSRIDLFQIGPFVIARPDRFFDGGDVNFAMTAALALFMAGWSFVRRDRTGLASFALCSMPFLLLYDPVVTTLAVRFSFYNLARIAALLGFTTYVAIAWSLARPARARGHSQARFLAGVALAGTLLLAIPYLQTTFTGKVGAVREGMNVSVWRSRGSDVRPFWGYSTIARMGRELGGGYPMLAADPQTGYYFSGLVPVRIVAAPRGHSPLAVEVVDGPQRRAAMRRLLYTTATVRERRDIIDAWGIDYVLLWKSRTIEYEAVQSMRLQPELFERIDFTRRLVLFRVRRPADARPIP